MTVIKKNKDKSWPGGVKIGTLGHLVEMQNGAAAMEKSMRGLKKLKLHCDSIILLLDIYAK